MSERTDHFLNLARMSETDDQKIRFFDENQKAFFLDPNSLEFDNALKSYADKQEINEEKAKALTEELEEMKWLELPESFKLYAFQYCILDGDVYNQ